MPCQLLHTSQFTGAAVHWYSTENLTKNSRNSPVVESYISKASHVPCIVVD